MKVPFAVRRKPCPAEKSALVATAPTIVPAGLMPKARVQKFWVGPHVAPGASNGVMVPSEARRKL